jgi:hypothetical protein
MNRRFGRDDGQAVAPFRNLHSYLEPGDIDEALRYAAFLAEDEAIELVPRADA